MNYSDWIAKHAPIPVIKIEYSYDHPMYRIGKLYFQKGFINYIIRPLYYNKAIDRYLCEYWYAVKRPEAENYGISTITNSNSIKDIYFWDPSIPVPARPHELNKDYYALKVKSLMADKREWTK